jgi:hypothetical protein
MRDAVGAVVVVAWLLGPLAVAPAQAGPYADDLTKCLVRSTTGADKNALVKWMFATAALHPEVRSIASVSDAQREELNRSTARLFEKLLTESCGAEAREAVKYEGATTLEGSFNVLGQVAARALFTDPTVADGLMALGKHLSPKLHEFFAPQR